MKKNKKNKAKKSKKSKKSLTAVGAVVAAGLTPGIVTSAPVSQQPKSDVEITAADIVSINGDVFDFDELFAMVKVNSDPQDIVVVYGSRPPQDKDKSKKKDKKKDKKNRQQEIEDSIRVERLQELERRERAYREAQMREQARQDSIHKAMMERHKTVYGPPPPIYEGVDPERLRNIIANDKAEGIQIAIDALMDHVFKQPLKDDVKVSIDANLISDLKMDTQQLKALSQEIEDRFGVQLTTEMIKRLGTVERIAKFIIEVAAPIKE